jgi:RND superfamily putative drug exporter
LALAAGRRDAGYNLSLGASGVSTLPDRLEAKQGYEALDRDFPQASSSPALIAVEGTCARRRFGRGSRGLRAESQRDPASGQRPANLRDGQVPRSASRSAATRRGEQALDAIRHLRSTTFPEAFLGTDAEVLVGGDTADNVDYIDAMNAWLPPVFAFVLGLSFILLTIAFRSIVVAATSMALNLLSVGAAYGLVVLVFLHGIGSGLFGFQRVDAIDAWVPLFLFSVPVRALDGLPGLPAQPDQGAVRS